MPHSFVLRCCTAPFFRFVIGTDARTLGRSSECHLVVSHPSISRHHARCRADAGGLIIADLRSRNGTFVDNRRIETSRVACDQTVRFGDVSFVVAIEDGAAAPDEEEETDLGKVDAKPEAAEVDRAVAQLSGGQRRVFELLLGGKKERSIARTLQLSPHTIHAHVRAIFRIFGVHSRLELLTRFLDRSPQ